MIVAAALPLVAEHGSGVTTLQVARAAGIGEATIFRAFADKESLLDAIVAEAFRPDHVVREIASISLDQPLADRLVEAADALRAHFDRMGAVLGALRGSGYGGGRRPSAPATDHRVAFDSVHEALADLFEPDRDSLRLPARRLARVFAGLLLTRGRLLGDQSETSPHELVDLLLHGALAPEGGDR